MDDCDAAVFEERSLRVALAALSSAPRSSVEVASPPRPAEESTTLSREETPDTMLDVEEIHRVFRLRDVHVAEVVEGLTEVASGGRVSWLPFLRFMCGLADIQPLRRDSCPAVAMARKFFNVFDEEKQQEVDLCALASGLSVSVRLQMTRQRRAL